MISIPALVWLAPESLSLSASEVVSASMSYIARDFLTWRGWRFLSMVTTSSLVQSGARSHFTASSEVPRQSLTVFNW